jgi:hypothetical protein
MITLSLLQTNWPHVREQLVALFRTTACKKEYAKLLRAANFTELFSVIWINYDWLRNHGCQIAELEEMTNSQLSTFALYILDNSHTSQPVEETLQSAILLHQRRLEGNEPTAEEWAGLTNRAWTAARHSNGANREIARIIANSTRQNNWDAALAMSNSLVRALWERERAKFVQAPSNPWTASRRTQSQGRASHRETLRQQAAIIGASAAALRTDLYTHLIHLIYNTNV